MNTSYRDRGKQALQQVLGSCSAYKTCKSQGHSGAKGGIKGHKGMCDGVQCCKQEEIQKCSASADVLTKSNFYTLTFIKLDLYRLCK